MNLFLSAERVPAWRQGREVVLEILWSCRGSEELINSVGLKVMSLAIARGAACQPGEPRALVVAWRRTTAPPQTGAAGQLDGIEILIRRTLTRTYAPILSSLRRIVPHVTFANGVWCRASRRNAQSRT